jgi:hypothetical protein
MNFRQTFFAALSALSLITADASVSFAAQEVGTGSTPVAASGGTAVGNGEVVSENKCDINSLKSKFESGKESYTAINTQNGKYFGKYQMGTAALEETGFIKKGTYAKYGAGGLLDSANWTGKLGINSTSDWLANSTVQEATEPEWEAAQLRQMPSSVKAAMGQQLPGGCGPLTEASYLMGAHLMGPGGVQSYLSSGGYCGKASSGQVKYDTTDGSGVCVQKYMCAGSSCQTVTKDMSKKICSTVMPTLNAINCSNYTGQQAALCNYAKPYLMTQEECQSAEDMAQGAKKGPNKEKCENSTFGPGSGSWSYALACSWASSAVANQDGTNEAGESPQTSGKGNTGAVSDPECMQKLEGMGVQFDKIGQFYNGTYGGTTCVIENAVALRGTAIPFAGQKLNMTCDMAIAMEKFGQQIKSLGVTSYFGIGSTRTCGPMRDKRGNLPGTITNHALGQAVDFTGVVIGGRQISMGKIHEPNTPDGAIASQVKAIACSTFRAVLSPTYAQYTGTFIHNHVEWAKLNVCR